LPMFLVRERQGRFRIVIDEAFNLPEGRGVMDEETFTDCFMKQQVSMLERTIRRYPDQWMMFRRFWVEGQGPERITST